MSEPFVVVSKAYDLALWIIPLTEKFPRTLRMGLAARLQNEVLDILRLLVEARYARNRLELLRRANHTIEYVRHLIRLAKDLKTVSAPQYEHASRLLDEVGRLAGSWRKRATE